METKYKRAWAEIDLDALAHNYRQIRSTLQAACKLCCIIKADAYGHGAVRVAKALAALGADGFGVSNVEEALQLRSAGIETPILVLGYTPAEAAPVLVQYHIAQCVYSVGYAQALAENAEKHGVTIKIHIKVDTGMNRLGFRYQNPERDAETLDTIAALAENPFFEVEGIFTHFAVSDEGDAGAAFTQTQYQCFCTLLKALENNGISIPLRHCANSAAVTDYQDMQLTMVRPGIILYGLYPSAATDRALGLRPILSLKSVISHLKTIEKGETVSYGRMFQARCAMRIATVPIGYADGYPRILGEKGAEVLIGEKRCPIVGRVCMDQLMVDVTALPQVHTGDEVILIGTAGKEKLSADEIARYQNSINYEVVCDIGKRVPRVYLQKGEIESIANDILPSNASFDAK